MNQPPPAIATAVHATRPTAPDTRLHGRWLMLARALWGMGVALAVGLFIASIAPFFASLHIICTGTSCGPTQLTPLIAARLQAEGLSVDFYATYVVGVSLIFALGYFGVAPLIFWHKSDDLMGLLASFGLATFVVAFTGSTQTLPSQWQLLSQLLNFLSNVTLALFFYLFPNGRFVPRWLRWCVVVSIIYWAFQAFLPSSPVNPIVRFPILDWVFPALLGSILFGQIYRYLRISTKVERQQTKWVVFGLVVALVGFVGLITLLSIFPSFFQPTSLPFLLLLPAVYFFILLIPLSLAMAMLRSHLWDIDVLINKTLVYGLLSVLLAAVYAGLVLGLQALLGGLLHQNNALALVVSTLAIVALFQPLHHRIQAGIDRRFYRRKYDAAKTLAAFSSTLQGEVDLDHLREQLLAVVEETMQPTHVSLWLRKATGTQNVGSEAFATGQEERRQTSSITAST